MPAYNPQYVERLALIRDGAQMIADGANKLLDAAEPKTTKKAEKSTQQEINSLKWINKTSDKGPYQTTTKTDNPDSPAFQKLQNYIKEHDGFVILHGFKFWSFSNNPDILGRRKK